MFVAISKDKLKQWIAALEPLDMNFGDKMYLAISRKKYKNLADLNSQAEYNDLELNLIFSGMEFLKKSKLKTMFEKYGDVDINVAIDNSTIDPHNIDFNESFYFYKMTVR